MGLIRRKRRRNSFRQKTKVNFSAIIVIISIAVLLGYGTAKFIIYPLFNSDNTTNTNNEGFKIEKFLSFFFNDDNTDDNLPEENQNNGQNTTAQGIEQNSEGSDKNIVEDQLNVTPTGQTAATTTQNGYCIQFGSFSTKLSAEALISELKTSGINAQIVEKDGAFKVVSQLFEQKEQAVATMNSLVGTKYADAFITQR